PVSLVRAIRVGGAVTGCVPFHENDGVRRAVRHGSGESLGDWGKDSDVGRVTDYAKTGGKSARRNEAVARRREIGRTNGELDRPAPGGQGVGVVWPAAAVESPRGHRSRRLDGSE